MGGVISLVKIPLHGLQVFSGVSNLGQGIVIFTLKKHTSTLSPSPDALQDTTQYIPLPRGDSEPLITPLRVLPFSWLAATYFSVVRKYILNAAASYPLLV